MYACAEGTVCMHVPLGVLPSQYDISLVLHASKTGITLASPFPLTFLVIAINLVTSSHCRLDNHFKIIFNLIELRFLSCTVPPSFDSFSPDRVVVENDPATITLSCSADGNPTPTVNWTRVFDGSDSDVLSTGNSYVINNNRNNAGTYRCKADNGIGSAINQTIRVTVNCEYSAFPSIAG